MAILKIFSRKTYERNKAKVDLAKSLCRLVGWEVETPTKLQKLVFRKLAPIIVDDDIWSLEDFFPSTARDYLVGVNSSIKCSYYALTDYIFRIENPDYISDEDFAILSSCSDYDPY